MTPQLHLMPFAFWIAAALLGTCLLVGWLRRRDGWGIPLIAVAGTVSFWYLGDALYNDYATYRLTIGESHLTAAWTQVALFALTLLLAAGPIHRALNKKMAEKNSSLLRFLETNATASDSFQHGLDLTCRTFAALWLALMALALHRTGYDFTGMFFPFLGEKANPWARGRVGGGLDAVISLAAYFHIFLAAAFGVIAALSRRRSTQILALTICAFTMPFFIFDRVRNAMLAVLLPGFLALVFIRIRQGPLIRAAILLAGFLALEGWFRFVIENRDKRSIVAAYQMLQTGEDDEVKADRDTKHLGLNMFEELGWINLFIETGRYQPNWGARYFAEIVNPIPRAIWKDKPLIGIDYAIARGMAWDQSEASEAGVAATVSTGMIGQGVVNFGRFLGPIAAALIMACWIAILARQDLLGQDIGRLVLFMVGLVLTFNMGRDITLLVLYPFVFGYLLIWWRDRHRAAGAAAAITAPASPRPPNRRRLPTRRRYQH